MTNGARRDLKAASAGVLAAAIMELAALPSRREPARRGELARRLALGAVLGVAYGRLVPPDAWSSRSGYGFGGNRLLNAAADVSGKLLHTPPAPLPMALWGGLTGFLLHLAA